jgi:hypothetical protein
MVAYVLVQRVLQLSGQLRESRVREHDLARSAGSTTIERDNYARMWQEEKQRVADNGAKLAEATCKLQEVESQITRLSSELRATADENTKLLARASTAENLNERYSLFFDDVGVQIGNYGFVDPGLFGLGRHFVVTGGTEGKEFEPDGIPATDRAERAHKRALIRRLAEREGVTLRRPRRARS